MSRLSVFVVGGLLGLFAGVAGAGEPVVFARHLSLSPDGTTLAFSWAGDIWTVTTDGGNATRLTVHPARDSHPVFSRDGSQIAFASERDGSACVYLMNADGGNVRRLTFGDQAELPADFSADDQYVYFHSRREGQNYWEPKMYRVPTAGGQSWAVLDCFGATPRLSPNGSKLVFERGRAEWWRRKYKGTASLDLWVWSSATNEYRQLTNVPGMDRLPIWDALGEGVYFLSDRAGNVNVWHQKLYGDAKQITFLSSDDVRDLALSGDGKRLAFTHWDKLYVLDLPGGQPREIQVTAGGDMPTRTIEQRTFTRDAEEAAPSPDGKEMALIVHGEIFVIKTEPDKLTRRVTNTPAREQHVTWSPDGKALFFISDEYGQEDIFRARSAEEPAKPLADSLRFKIERITDTPLPEFRPQVSPDGKRLAYLRERGDLIIRDLAGGGETTLFTSWNDPNYAWSPDSKWIAYEIEDEEYNADVWVVPADGSQPPVNISQHPDADGNPHWSADGQMLAFTSRRLGNDLDIYMVFLAPKLDEKSNVELLEYFENAGKAVKKRKPLKSAVASGDIARAGHTPPASKPAETTEAKPRKPADAGQEGAAQAVARFLKTVLETIDPPAKPEKKPAAPAGDAPEKEKSKDGDDDKSDDEKKDTAADEKKEKDKPEKFEYDLKTAYQRLRRVTSVPGDQARFALAPDGASFALLSAHEGSGALYFCKWNGEELKKAIPGAFAGLEWGLDGGRLFYLKSGVPGSCKAGGAEPKDHAFTARVQIAARLEAAQKYDDAARTLGLRFYHPTMKDTDWPALTVRHRELAMRVTTPFEFCEIFNMQQGELNASHLNCFPPPSNAPSERLGYLGVELDREYDGAGLRIAAITPETPADRAESKLYVGDVLLSVNGLPVGRDAALEQALLGAAGDPIVIELLPSTARPAPTTKPATTRPGDDAEKKNAVGNQADPKSDATDAPMASNEPTAETAPAAAEPKPLQVVIRPAGYGDFAAARYKAWVAANRKYVEDASGGRIGYAHIRAMSEQTFHEFERDLYAAGYGKDGLIIDVRNNTGGFTTDWVMNILMYRPHSYAISRGGVKGYPQDRRVTYAWTKPATLMCNQYSFSNGETISHAFKTLKRGPVIGVPTWGGVISTGRYELIDGSAIRMPTRGWYLPDGVDMENNGAAPDILVWQTPPDEAAGREAQLDAAIKATEGQLQKAAAR